MHNKNISEKNNVTSNTESYGRKNPFLSTLTDRHPLTKFESKKNSQHLVVDITGSGYTYQPGDSAAIMPINDPDIIHKTLLSLKASGEEIIIDKRSHKKYSLSQYLREKVSITKLTKRTLSLLYSHQHEGKKKQQLNDLLLPENKNEMIAYLENHHLWDLIEEHQEVFLDPQELCSALLPLVPRLYSIASSQTKNPNQLELAVIEVSYTTNDILRHGVCSRYLCSTATTGAKLPIFIHKTPRFYLPEEKDTPIIMVGPGTGVAPFRGFMEERRITGASNKNWLFFGDWNQAYDFYYEEEWSGMIANGFLRLDTAFSRDQKHKIYVQHKILENSTEIWKWLESGAYFYICGDAFRMAKDVEAAILKIAQTEGNLSEEEAINYIQCMKTEKRYRLDVY